MKTPYRILLVLACLALSACGKNLIEGLDERQANEVVATLLKSNIAAEKQNKAKAGFIVRVDAGDLLPAIELLQRENLPSKARMEISSAFPADALVSTPQGERARLYSAIEQRLEQSLSVLDGVKSARVHVSYDVRQNTNGREEEAPMHVAAVLLRGESVDEEALIQSVKRFLRNSFARIDYDNVSVVIATAPGPYNLGTTPAPSSGPVPLVYVALGLGLLSLMVAGLFLSGGPQRQTLRARRDSLKARWALLRGLRRDRKVKDDAHTR